MVLCQVRRQHALTVLQTVFQPVMRVGIVVSAVSTESGPTGWNLNPRALGQPQLGPSG